MYADPDEQKEMKICHSRCIELMKEFLQSIEDMSHLRALDVAGGDARFSKFFLVDMYDKVDLFDQCPIGVKKAQTVLKGHKKFGYADIASM